MGCVRWMSGLDEMDNWSEWNAWNCAQPNTNKTLILQWFKLNYIDWNGFFIMWLHLDILLCLIKDSWSMLCLSIHCVPILTHWYFIHQYLIGDIGDGHVSGRDGSLSLVTRKKPKGFNIVVTLTTLSLFISL